MITQRDIFGRRYWFGYRLNLIGMLKHRIQWRNHAKTDAAIILCKYRHPKDYFIGSFCGECGLIVHNFDFNEG